MFVDGRHFRLGPIGLRQHINRNAILFYYVVVQTSSTMYLLSSLDYISQTD